MSKVTKYGVAFQTEHIGKYWIAHVIIQEPDLKNTPDWFWPLFIVLCICALAIWGFNIYMANWGYPKMLKKAREEVFGKDKDKNKKEGDKQK